MRPYRGLAVAILLVSPVSLVAAESLEAAIKATFLYKFAEFVQWPGDPVATGAPFILCGVGDDDVTALMDRAAAGQRVGDRPIVVRHLQQVSPASGCQVAYLAGSPAQSAEQAAAALRGSPVLTVTDAASHPGAAAAIKFVKTGNHVRFDIDDASAAEDHLFISSKLLGLARNVRKRP